LEGAVGVQTYGITGGRNEIRHASYKVCDGPERYRPRTRGMPTI
jgi:hypothetical protein